MGQEIRGWVAVHGRERDGGGTGALWQLDALQYGTDK